MERRALLKLENIETHYDGIKALKGISLEVLEGLIVVILGANGAGKTTTLRTISGIIRASGGAIEFMGQRIERTAPEKIVPLGISHVPEGRGIFYELTVMENLKMGCYLRNDQDGIKEDYQKVMDYFPILDKRRAQIAGTLSGGEQQMLAIARGLMARPKLLMLDEPSMGLAPLLVREIFQIIKRINEEGTTVLLVEQNANLALMVAHYGYVLETGKIALSDESENLLENEYVRRSYLGG